MTGEYQDPKMVEDAYRELHMEEQEQLNTEKIEELSKQMKSMQCLIMARLETVPDLANKIEALSQSRNFKDLGNALRPITTKPPAPVKPKKQWILPSWTKPQQHIKLLDAFAAVMVFVMWIGFSYGILEAFALSWSVIVGLAGLWLGFVVAFRLVIGGILD